MHFRLLGTRIRVDTVLLLLFPMGIMLGAGYYACVLAASLVVHELSHLLAAKALGIPVCGLRMTPFGGFASIGNPYTLDSARLCAVSAAGPAATLLLLLLSSATCHWLPASRPCMIEIVHVNAVLLVYNLLPALPLDGGRILCALLSRHIGYEKAVRIGVLLARLLASVLLLFCILQLIVARSVSLPLPIASLLLLISSSEELNAVRNSRVYALISEIQPIKKPVPASIIAIDADYPPENALKSMGADRFTIFALCSGGRLLRLVSAATLLEYSQGASPNE